MNRPLPNYFCDLAMADVNAISCSASRLLCHGSTHGAFSKFSQQQDSIDLDSIDAFSVNLVHLSSDPLSSEYEYHLVYLSSDAYQQLWNGCKINKIPGIKALASEIHLGSKAKLCPKNKGHLFGSHQLRSIALTKYSSANPIDHYVPHEYRLAFKEKFTGLLIRTKKECQELWNLLEAHGFLPIAERKVTDEYDGDLMLQCYSA